MQLPDSAAWNEWSAQGLIGYEDQGIGDASARSAAEWKSPPHIVRHRGAAEPGEHRRRHIVGATAARLGGDNRGREDTDRVNLTEALRAFMFRSMGAEVSLLSYAGHGFEKDGVNYLLPVRTTPSWIA